MAAEEHMLLQGTYTALSTPSNPSLTARTADSGETVQTGLSSGNTIWVKVTATNFFGETTA
jgi:hypothetical protein